MTTVIAIAGSLASIGGFTFGLYEAQRARRAVTELHERLARKPLPCTRRQQL
jgi:hypothetical protein